MRSLGPIAALATGSTLFAVLTYYAQPIALQVVSQPEYRQVLLLAYGGSGTIGAIVVVLMMGRLWGVPLGGLLCPMLGAFIYEAVIEGPTRSGFTWGGALAGMVLNVVQYSIPAMLGAMLAWGTFAAASYLRRTRRISRI